MIFAGLMPDGFFFLRPLWLLLLIPLMLLIAVLLRHARRGDSGAWNQLVDAHLLKHLAVRQTGGAGSGWLAAALGAALLAAIVAMAGPTWQKIEMPSFKPASPAVIVLSMAQSMNAEDLAPSRLARAGHKVHDILRRASGGDLGLVVYADRPFVAAPLTNDVGVIEEMLPELSPNLMPVLGNRLDYAIAEAGQLLERSGARRGRIIVIADDAGSEPGQSLAVAREALSMGYRVAVLGVGSLDGAPLQTASGRVLRDADGAPMITRLAEHDLSALARAGGGAYARLSAGDADLARLLADSPAAAAADRVGEDLQADSWNDVGYWLLIVPVLLTPLAFRRGLLMLLPLCFAAVALPQSQTAEAGWTEFWQTRDQQAASVFERGEYAAAAGTFENPEWKASALYKSGEYDQAAELFAQAGVSSRDFNLGNSLAQMGKFEQAIAAYDRQLEANPGDEDAKFNRDLVASLLERQRQREQPSQDENQEPQDQSGQGEKDQQQQRQSGQGDQDRQQQGQSGQGDESQQQQGQSGHGDESQQQQGQSGQGDESQQQQSQFGQGGQSQQQQAQPGQGGRERQQVGSAQQPADQVDGEREQASAPQADADKPTPAPGERQDSDAEQARAVADESDEQGKSALREAMDALLQGNGGGSQTQQPPRQDESANAAGGFSELEQAREQQLRAVPDDSSGLLRARIRQYYQRLRGARNNG